MPTLAKMPNDPLLILALSLFTFGVFLFWVARILKRKGHPFAAVLESITYFLIPTALLFDIILEFGADPESAGVRVVETLLGFQVIWIFLSLIKAALVISAREHHWSAKVPGLFLDLIRILFAVVGAVIVTAYVWNYDATKFLATLGVGSLVLGLALQETLGNLFAGISLLFEQPFKVGDWIKVGDLVGEVIGTNWRSVRLRTRDMVMIVVPNAVLGREKIENFSQPTPVVGILAYVGFSYSDPPNKVKKILMEVLSETPKVLKSPRPKVRTKKFDDSGVNYELKFFIDDFVGLPEIEEDVKTRIWYAARRLGLTIPYPMRIVQKTEVPAEPRVDRQSDIVSTLKKVQLFEPLNPDEHKAIARDAMILEFGDKERVVEQGDAGDSLYVIQRGAAIVSVKDQNGSERDISRLSAGDFFGEMGLLTGEPRTATVRADGDLTVLVIYKDAMQKPIATRPELASDIAQIAEARRAGLKEWRVSSNAALDENAQVNERAGMLVTRIRKFFGIT